MIISSWNVNSVRVRLNHIIEYLKINKPRFLLLQEIKTENKNFPYSELKAMASPTIINYKLRFESGLDSRA